MDKTATACARMPYLVPTLCFKIRNSQHCLPFPTCFPSTFDSRPRYREHTLRTHMGLLLLSLHLTCFVFFIILFSACRSSLFLPLGLFNITRTRAPYHDISSIALNFSKFTRELLHSSAMKSIMANFVKSTNDSYYRVDM